MKIHNQPDPALIESMCYRFRHDFGLPKDELGQGFTEEEREVLRSQMRQVWEEVVGKGFYIYKE